MESGTVDAGDYDVWRFAFGQTLDPPPALTIVPEPASSGLTVVGLLWILGYVRMRKSNEFPHS